MQAHTLLLTETGLLHPLAKNYLQSEPKLEHFYNFTADNKGISRAIAQRRHFPVNRTLLINRLRDQYLQINTAFFEQPENLAVSEAIESLSNENTFTVTTGHQLNVFTGPLFFIYKIISAINYVRWLKIQFPGNNFVPVYWMATEDHDFEEINHIHLFGKKIEWQAKAGGAVGRINPKDLAEQISIIGDQISASDEGRKLIKIFKSAYLNQPTLSLATRALVHELFKEDGLIILDADDAALKRSFIPVMKKELLEQTAENAMNITNHSLEKEYKLPVNPRPINLFYLTENARVRIEKNKENDYFADSVKRWTKDDILDELENHPENFSPNVVLRPVYQELILPNLAYIGGNNEIAYWLELKKAFDNFGIFYPQLLVRDSALWLGKKFAKELLQMKLKPAELLLPLQELKTLFYERNELNHPSEAQIDKLIAETDYLKMSVQGLAKTVASVIVQQSNLQINELKKLKKEIRKKREEEQQMVLQKLEKIHQSIYPAGSFQERYDNFISYYLQYGPRFFHMLKAHFNPIDSSIKIFSDI